MPLITSIEASGKGDEWYGMVQIKAYLTNGQYHQCHNPNGPWVDYGTGDTERTAESVASSMQKHGFETRILKNGDGRIVSINADMDTSKYNRLGVVLYEKKGFKR